MSSSPMATAAPSSYRWVVLALVVGCFVFTFVVRFIWSPLIPVVAPILGMSMSQAGAYMSAFFFGYVTTQVPAGVLADRFGVRLLLTGSMLIDGIATFLMPFVSGYDQGFALRVVMGLAAGADFSCCARALIEWFPVRERGTAFGIMLAGPSAGLLLANFIAPPLTDALGWQGTLQVVGAATFAFGIAVYFLLRASNLPQGERSPLEGFRVIFSSRDLVLTAVSGFCLLWMQTSVATWANAYMKQVGLSLSAAAGVMMLYSVGGIVSPILSGLISDRLRRHAIIVIVGLLLVSPLAVLFGYQTNFLALAAAAFAMGLASYLASPQQTILISQFAGKEWAATANGVGNFIYQLASIVGPFVVGMSVDLTGNFGLVWWIMGAGPLLGALLMLPVRENRSRP